MSLRTKAGVTRKAVRIYAAARALANLVPARIGNRRAAVLFLTGGIIGVIMPVIPGWPFLFAAAGLMASSKRQREANSIDTWMEANFPTARREGRRLAERVLSDLDRRFPTPTQTAVAPVAPRKEISA